MLSLMPSHQSIVNFIWFDDFVPGMPGKYQRLQDIVSRVSELKLIQQSAPHILKPK